MSWYDVFSTVYDPAIEWLYRPYRRLVARALEIETDALVLDLACGTGQNFPTLVGCGARVVGVDSSAGMLRRARRLIERQDWHDRVTLLQHDARRLDTAALRGVGVERPLDGVLCTLGFSALPEWRQVMADTFALLRPAGRFVVFDVYAQRWVPQSFIVRRIARADLHRRSWQQLEQLASSGDDSLPVQFRHRWLPGSPHLHGGRLFLASAVHR